jgi:hypothetical protein
MVRVVLPSPLSALMCLPREVHVAVEGPITLRGVLDQLEALQPKLAGTIREHGTLARRPMVRFFACEQDISLQSPDNPLPDAIADGTEPLFIIAAIAGGSR